MTWTLWFQIAGLIIVTGIMTSLVIDSAQGKKK